MLGAPCKMPTKENFEELINPSNCTNEHVDNYKGSGVSGRLFTSVANGETLFFPYAGGVNESTLQNAGEDGRYWSASLLDEHYACRLGVSSNRVDTLNGTRCYGYTVRAVK